MRRMVAIGGLAVLLLLVAYAQQSGSSGQASEPMAAPAKPTDGYTVHVLAPHVVKGQVMGPFHHYCKQISPEPIIQCQIYNSTEANAPLTQIEYIVAKSITRGGILKLKRWNRDWHDHKQEIATGRVQVLDASPEQAKAIAEAVSKTDGLIFDLWPHGSKIPTGASSIAQSVGHVKLKSLTEGAQ